MNKFLRVFFVCFLVHIAANYAPVRAQQDSSFQAEVAPLFHNGLLKVVKNKRGKYQYAILRDDQTYAVPFGQYDYISSQTSSGLFVVCTRNKFGIINAKLDTVLPITRQWVYYTYYQCFIVNRDNKYILLDSMGCQISNMEFDSLDFLSNERIAAYKNGTLYIIGPDYDIFCPDFTKVINKINPETNNIPGGELVVSKDGKLGVVDSNYLTIIPFIYENILYDQFYAPFFYVQKNGKWAVFTIGGRQITDFLYDWINEEYRDEEGYTSDFLVLKNDQYGKIDRNGKELIPCAFDAISFNEDVAFRNMLNENGKGHYVIKDNRMGYVNEQGMRIPTEFDYVRVSNNNSYALVCKGKLRGIWDLLGDSLSVPVQYHYIFSKGNSEFVVNDRGQWKLINMQNQLLDQPDTLRAIIKKYHLKRHRPLKKDYNRLYLRYMHYNQNVYASPKTRRLIEKYSSYIYRNDVFYHKME